MLFLIFGIFYTKEGIYPAHSQEAAVSIACPVFFGQKHALYCQKTPVSYYIAHFFM